MRIKKFNNIWTMGLIMFVAILIGVYAIKIINPSFIVGIAEIDSIVAIGNFINNNMWAYYFATTIISFIIYWLFCCACCRKKTLNKVECLIILLTIILLFICEKFAYFMYYEVNMLSMIIVPSIILVINKKQDIKYLYSVTICTTIHFVAQAFSLQIRNIMLLVSHVNYATLIVLMIDMYIWLFIMYFYFNNKKEE